MQPLSRESQAEAGGRHARRALQELDYTTPRAASSQPHTANRENRLGKIELDSLPGPQQTPTSFDLSLVTPFAKFPPNLSPVTDTSKHYSPYLHAQAEVCETAPPRHVYRPRKTQPSPHKSPVLAKGSNLGQLCPHCRERPPSYPTQAQL